MRMTLSLAIALAFGSASRAAPGARPIETPPIGFEALLGFDALPLLADRPAFQDSSYHRDDINADAGNFIRVEPNGDQVLTDTDGPGVIYRTWSTGVVGMQMSKDCRLRFFFDGEADPRLDLSMAELFGAEASRWPFVPPLSVTFESGVGGGEGPCNLCYVPIPFAKHIKIVGRNVMFYHVDYQKLPAGTPVESFSFALAEKHRAALEKAAAQWERIPARPGGKDGDETKTLDAFDLAPGATRAIAVEGEGMVSAIRVKIAEPAPRVLRGIALEIAFDGMDAPCVRVPIGDFFGSGCGDRRFETIPCGMTDDGYYAYWPMPFRRSARVSLRNGLSSAARILSLAVSWLERPVPANAGYFHARYVQDPDIAMRKDYRILEVAGHGKFVGTNVTMQNARGAQGIFFLEGDEKIYVDGEAYPSRWLGTGTEDYFNGSYFWNAPKKDVMVRPYGGLTFLDWGIGRVCAYRWHVTDFIPFAKEIRVDLEHGGVSDWPGNYQSVAYYYLEKPAPQPPLPALAARLPRTPLPAAPKDQSCEIVAGATLGGKPLAAVAIPDLDPEYESSDSILVGRGKPGDVARIPLRVPGVDDFGIVIFLAGGPDYDKVEVALDGTKVGEIDARRPGFTPWFSTEFPPRRIAGGVHALELTLAGGETASGSAPDLAVGVVAVQLRPKSRLIDAWSVVGNWPCPKEGGWEVANEPERNPDLDATYTLPNGTEVRWREHEGDFVGLGGGDWLVAYGLTYIHSPDDRTVACFIAKDDGLKIWVNDEVAYDQNTWSHSWLDQFFCTMHLKKGWNRVLVKCYNWSGAWAFALRPGDPEKGLRYARKPE
ncbi:MAG: DUF2961 domain-containing protein [Planctomycetes bacterium]|nr:DUF2961 domain-containing protein [Planctomycetota bacterium]